MSIFDLTHEVKIKMIRLRQDFFGAVMNVGAKINSPSLCAIGFGRAHAGKNSTALRIAAENESYDVVERILDMSAIQATGISHLTSFRFGEDWSRVNELAAERPALARLLSEHEEKASEAMDSFLYFSGNIELITEMAKENSEINRLLWSCVGDGVEAAESVHQLVDYVKSLNDNRLKPFTPLFAPDPN